MIKSKKKALLVLAVIMVLLSWAGWMKLSDSTSQTVLYDFNKNKSELVVNVDNNYKYIRIAAGGKTIEKSVPYEIVSPDNKVVKQGYFEDGLSYLGASQKGKWKIVFNVDDEEYIKCSIWAGNGLMKDNSMRMLEF